MSKTLSATPMREPERACRIGAPGGHVETPASEDPPDQVARTRRTGVRAARQRGSSPRVSSPRVTSNLGQPVGVLSWERDLLLGLAVDVLDDFVGSTNGQDD